MPGFLEFLFGRPEKTQQLSRFSPEQLAQQQSLFSQGQNMLRNPSFNFQPIAEEARTNFAERTVPSLAERFTSMGGQRSSAFGQQLGAAGADLEKGLASLQSQYGLQQQGQLQNLLQALLGQSFNPTFENLYTPRSPGLFESGLTGLASGVGASLPFLLGGGLGGGLGALSSMGGGLGRLGSPSPTSQLALPALSGMYTNPQQNYNPGGIVGAGGYNDLYSRIMGG